MAIKDTKTYEKLVGPFYWFLVRRGRSITERYYDLVRDKAFGGYARREVPLLHEARMRYPDSDFDIENPLVTVYIPTYNRGRLLCERTIPSVLNQTHANIELIVVADNCTDGTPDLVRKFGDRRIRLVELREKEDLPKNKVNRWRAAGTAAVHAAMDAAKGLWLAHLDDDDVFERDHVEVLLDHGRKRALEFVFGKTRVEMEPGRWIERGGPCLPSGLPPYRHSKSFISHSSIMYRHYLRLFKYDVEAWRLRYGADAHKWQRLGRAGVRGGFVDKVVTTLPLRPGETLRGIRQPD